MERDFEYRGWLAKAWDLLRGDTSAWPDRAFWLALLERHGGPGLDVGCGTGRLLLDYLGRGLDVDGVDNSPEMLALCRGKAAAGGIDLAGRLFEQEMEALDLPRRYGVIFVPSLSFQLVTDPAAAARALQRFGAHLAPGGLLSVSFKSRLWPGRRTPAHMEWSDWFRLAEARRAEDGLTVRRWIRTRYDHAGQLEHEENRYEILRDERVIETEAHARSPNVRWYSQEQAMALFERAGFTEARLTGGDTLEPASPDEIQFKITASGPAISPT